MSTGYALNIEGDPGVLVDLTEENYFTMAREPYTTIQDFAVAIAITLG